MTVSIFLISAILVLFAFWVYYRKQKESNTKPKEEKQLTKIKRPLNDIDKMLSHIAEIEQVENVVKNNEKDGEYLSEIDKNIKNKDKDTEILNERILGSIIFEKKKKK